MKNMSVKLKITLWYTAIMAVLSAVVLAVMVNAGKSMIERDITSRLTRTVNDFSRRVSGSGGRADNVPEFGFYEQGVHILMYDENHNIIGGRLPFKFSDTSEFADDSLNDVTEEEGRFFVYTRVLLRRDKPSYWVRGIVLVNDETFAVKSAAKNNIILTVILIIAAAAGGYLIAGRILSPVEKIRRTASDISDSSDLTQRIHLGSGTDELHALANTFDGMLDKLEQTMEREKQFTSDASHELRTPIAVILSECEYMTDCAENFDEIREGAYSVKNQAEKMSKLVSELLTISRMDKNTYKTEFENVDFSELLGFVCDEQEEIHDENITLSREIRENITVNGDRALLARLCINLISNAYRYGKNGGSITVSLDVKDGMAILSVTDDGIGISAENLPKIWERFFQAEPSRTDGSGMGLGLSMVKWIAECHGGSVSAESELGKGSCFTFKMPL